jgi:hypothetical protein
VLSARYCKSEWRFGLNVYCQYQHDIPNDWSFITDAPDYTVDVDGGCFLATESVNRRIPTTWQVPAASACAIDFARAAPLFVR